MPPVAADPINRSLYLRTTGSTAFDFTPAARCYYQGSGEVVRGSSYPRLAMKDVADVAECERYCAARSDCLAAQFNHPGCPMSDSSEGCLRKPQCVLFAQCLERARAGAPMRSDVLHRWGPTWPPRATPNHVRWQTNAALVIVSYKASLSYLRTLPGKLMDLVVYHKADFGRPNVTYAPMTAEYVLGHLREQELCGSWLREALSSMPSSSSYSPPPPFSATGTTILKYGYPINVLPTLASTNRLHHPTRFSRCPVGCACGKRVLASRPRLQYFALLPNYGWQHKEPHGGSREPYGYLQFILDFWDNMPPVVIFSQDDCLARGCMWGNQLQGLRQRLQHWEREWGPGEPIKQSNCLCKFTKEEDKFKSRGYHWYRWMSFFQERIFNTTPGTRSTTVTWPQDATFAVGRAKIRLVPRWLYESMLRITTVESACMGAGSITWAHAFERLWFELLDPAVPKALRAVIGQDQRGACFLGARRRR